ncbi:MAG: histidine kinase dimerization/phospho-acceptor domain-containing protein, partial [Limisphaerales bacterium]
MKTLRTRLVSYYSALVTITVALALLGGFFLVKRQLLHGTDFLLEAEFQEIKARLDQLPQAASTNELEQAIGKHTSLDAPFFFFQIHDMGGRVVYRSANLGSKVLPDLTPTKLDRFTMTVGDLGVLRVREFDAGALHAQVATSMNQITALSNRFFQASLVAVPSVLLVSIAIGFLLCEITLRPLRAIEQTARRISFSNLKERIPTPLSKDEIGRLAALLNAMFDRLEQSFEQIKQFTADFSHELRTPLSIIALHTEKVLKKPSLDPESANELTEVLSETRRLNHIIDQLLTLAKAESQTLPLHLVPQSTSQFIQEFAEDATALTDASGKQFHLLMNEELTVTFDGGWIRQVLFNL